MDRCMVHTVKLNIRYGSGPSVSCRCGSLILITFLSFAAACGHHNVEVAVPNPDKETPVSFLEDGQTTRSDIISRFGKLAASFEGGRILVFALDKKYTVTPNEHKVRFHLTLVFNEQDEEILKKHNLVRIK